MNTPENKQNPAVAQEYQQPFDFVSDFEAIKIYFDRVENLIQLYREMLEENYFAKEPAPYVLETLWQRRELYFSQFEAIEILFSSALAEMTETVDKAYQFCRRSKQAWTQPEKQTNI